MQSCGMRQLHAAPVLTAHLKQGVGDLAQRADPHRVHQHLKHVGVVDHGLLEAGDHGGGFGRVTGVEVVQTLQLRLFFFLGGAREFDGLGHRVAMRRAEGVDADDGVLAGVLEHLVVHALFLDF
jgi:hypothetical protein